MFYMYNLMICSVYINEQSERVIWWWQIIGIWTEFPKWRRNKRRSWSERPTWIMVRLEVCTAQSHFNSVNLLRDTHNRHSIAHPWSEIWESFMNLSVDLCSGPGPSVVPAISCLLTRQAVNIAANNIAFCALPSQLSGRMTALWRHQQ